MTIRGRAHHSCSCAVTTIGGKVFLARNDALFDLSGMGALSSIGADLAIGENDALERLDGLDAIRTVGGDLNVADNPALCEDLVDEFAARLDTLGGSISNSGNTGACAR